MFKMKLFCSLIFFIFSLALTTSEEPPCSKFHYEAQTLEKMIRMEVKVEVMEKEILRTNQLVLESLQALKNEKENLANDYAVAKKSILDENEKLETNYLEQERGILDEKEKLKQSIAETLLAHTKAIKGVYFSAFTNRHYSNDELRTDPVLKFQDVEINQGLAYNSTTGNFTAPFDGGYRFDWSILINQDGKMWLCLVKNDACAVKSVGYAGSSYYWKISHSAILQLKAGDSVRLTYVHGPASIYGSEGRYTSFSGQYLD